MIVDITPDPKISNLRPAWLSDDKQWRAQLEAMEPFEVRWIEHHWDLADGGKPGVDTSWITMTTVGGEPHWAWPIVLVGCLVVFGAMVALVDWGI